MKRFLAVLALLPLLVAAQCNTRPSSPPPAPVVDAGPIEAGGSPPVVVDAGPIPDTTPGVRLACEAITAAGCPEGGPACYRVLQRAVDAQITVAPLGCLAGAHTKSDVHACGPLVACP